MLSDFLLILILNFSYYVWDIERFDFIRYFSWVSPCSEYLAELKNFYIVMSTFPMRGKQNIKVIIDKSETKSELWLSVIKIFCWLNLVILSEWLSLASVCKVRKLPKRKFISSGRRGRLRIKIHIFIISRRYSTAHIYQRNARVVGSMSLNNDLQV